MDIERRAEPIGVSDRMARLLRAGILTGISDWLFAVALFTLFYHITFTRLWQGVAAVPLGPRAIGGGSIYTWIGVLFHFLVAFTWSAIFLFLFMRSQSLRRTAASPYGVFKIAAVYGPLIWVVMSLIVIPAFAHKAPAITARWWIQLIGHFPFVGLPMVASIARPPDLISNPPSTVET